MQTMEKTPRKLMGKDFNLILPGRPLKVAYFSLRLVSLLPACVSGLPDVTSNSNVAEKETVLTRVASRDLPLLQTDKQYNDTNASLPMSNIDL